MIAKVVALSFVVAVASSTYVAPGLLNAGILAPGLLNSAVIPPGAPLLSAPLVGAVPSTVATRTVVATPGAITTDRRVIGTTGLLAGAPLAYGNGILAPGLYGASPLALSTGIVSPFGLRGAGILAAPGVLPTLLKK